MGPVKNPKWPTQGGRLSQYDPFVLMDDSPMTPTSTHGIPRCREQGRAKASSYGHKFWFCGDLNMCKIGGTRFRRTFVRILFSFEDL